MVHREVVRVLIRLLAVLGTTALSIVILFLLTKLMGNKQVSQMNVFDYIVGITIGSIAAELATELEQPWEPLFAMVVYGVAAWGISELTSRFLPVLKIVNGRPLILLENGKLYRENLKKSRINLSEFLTICRINGFFDLAQLQSAILESNGNISFLPRETERPVTPEDLNLSPPQKYTVTSVILDGKINAANLRKTGNNEQWLKKALKAQGYGGPEAVYLATCDQDNNLSVYPMATEKRTEDPFE